MSIYMAHYHKNLYCAEHTTYVYYLHTILKRLNIQWMSMSSFLTTQINTWKAI